MSEQEAKQIMLAKYPDARIRITSMTYPLVQLVNPIKIARFNIWYRKLSKVHTDSYEKWCWIEAANNIINKLNKSI